MSWWAALVGCPGGLPWWAAMVGCPVRLPLYAVPVHHPSIPSMQGRRKVGTEEMGGRHLVEKRGYFSWTLSDILWTLLVTSHGHFCP